MLPQPASAAGLSGLIAANRVTAVNFWATWCPPCVTEMPGFDSVYRQMRARGVGIVGVNDKESAATVSAFVRRRGISYPILLDPEGSLFASYGVSELPATFIVDQQGRVPRSFTGDVSAASLRGKLESVLREA